MAEAAPEVKKTRKRKSGPRNVKPTFLLIGVSDANGNPIELTEDQVSVKGTKDPTELLKLITSGGLNGQIVKELIVQEPAPKPKAEQPATA